MGKGFAHKLTCPGSQNSFSRPASFQEFSATVYRTHLHCKGGGGDPLRASRCPVH